MHQPAQEITREYRLDFADGGAHWRDPMPFSISSGALGGPTRHVINRTSLLAWSLTALPHVVVADVTSEGWMRILVRTGPTFDESGFRLEMTEVLEAVRDARSAQDPPLRAGIPIGSPVTSPTSQGRVSTRVSAHPI